MLDRFSIKNILGGVTQFLVNQDKEGTIIPTYHGAGGQKTVFLSNRCNLDALSEDIMSELWMKVSGASLFENNK